VDPSTRLKQLQKDNEKYRASIESGHLMLHASIVEPIVKPSYQFKYMQTSAAENMLPEQNA
jgi:hypothetical protein